MRLPKLLTCLFFTEVADFEAALSDLSSLSSDSSGGPPVHYSDLAFAQRVQYANKALNLNKKWSYLEN